MSDSKTVISVTERATKADANRQGVVVNTGKN